MAGILGVKLGGTNFYDGIAQERPVLGQEGRDVGPGDIMSAVRVMVAASVLGISLAVGFRCLA